VKENITKVLGIKYECSLSEKITMFGGSARLQELCLSDWELHWDLCNLSNYRLHYFFPFPHVFGNLRMFANFHLRKIL